MNTHLARRWPLLSLLALASVATGGWFQAPSPPPGEVPAPTIRVTTHLVLVDVVVTDKQGKPITGLHPEDFEVEENGKTQKISTFVPAGENLAAAQPLPPASRAPTRSPATPEYRTGDADNQSRAKLGRPRHISRATARVALPVSRKSPGTLTPAAINPIVATEAATMAAALTTLFAAIAWARRARSVAVCSNA